MLATGLIAIDATILATAVPSIVRDLGSYQQFPWLFSVYLLAQAVSVPIYSRFADTVGRKPIILLGIALFLLGSLLSGFAWSMTALIVFRIIQGLGAGAVAPMSMTIVGDIYTVAERAKCRDTSHPSGRSRPSSALRSAASSPSSTRGGGSSGSTSRCV